MFTHQVLKNITHSCLFYLLLALSNNWVLANSTVQENLAEINLNNVGSGQLLFQQPNNNRFLQAPNLTTKAHIDIKGMVANSHIEQIFTNTTDTWQHAVYVFPLPDNAAVNQLIIKVGDREIIGVVKEKQAAKRIYQAAQKAGKKAALLEQLRPNLFTTKVANIAPHERITVSLTYFQQVNFSAGVFSLDFPMAITPRYQAAKINNTTINEISTTQDHHFDAGENFYPEPELPNLLFHQKSLTNTPHSNEINKENHNALAQHNAKHQLANVDLTLTLDSGAKLKTINSRYHDILIKQDNTGKFNLALSNQPLNKDFELHWQYQPQAIPQVLNFTDHYQQELYGLLMVLPNYQEKAQPPPPITRELTFIIDRSGSMAGNSMKQAKQAFEFALSTLNANDKFQLISFNEQATRFFHAPVFANEHNKTQALTYVQNLHATGGTEIKSALALALHQLNHLHTAQEQATNLSQIVFLTDGAVGNEAEIFSMLNNNIAQQRLFTVGLGSAPNRYFMKKAAELGRGSYQFIGNNQALVPEMEKLFTKLNQPVLTNIAFSLAAANAQISSSPNPIPDVYANEPIFISYKVNTKDLSPSTPLTANLTAAHQGTPWLLKIDNLSTPDTGSMIRKPLSQHVSDFPANKSTIIPALATLWARRKIDDHYREFMLYRNIHAKAQIIDLALTFNLVTPFTSLLAVEHTPARTEQQKARNKQLSNQLPDGQKLPQTALNYQWQLYLALLLLLSALVYYLLNKNIPQARLLVTNNAKKKPPVRNIPKPLTPP